MILINKKTVPAKVGPTPTATVRAKVGRVDTSYCPIAAIVSETAINLADLAPNANALPMPNDFNCDAATAAGLTQC